LLVGDVGEGAQGSVKLDEAASDRLTLLAGDVLVGAARGVSASLGAGTAYGDKLVLDRVDLAVPSRHPAADMRPVPGEMHSTCGAGPGGLWA
jgi:hypothetical protein